MSTSTKTSIAHLYKYIQVLFVRYTSIKLEKKIRVSRFSETRLLEAKRSRKRQERRKPEANGDLSMMQT